MVNRNIEENRREQYGSSVRMGGLKEGLEKSIQKVASPLTDALAPFVANVTKSNMADPAVRLGLEFAVTQMVAELLQAGGHFADQLPGVDLDNEDDVAEKFDAAARAVRGYSAERMGEKASSYAVSFLPLVKKLLTDATMAGVFDGATVKGELPPASEKTVLDESDG